MHFRPLGVCLGIEQFPLIYNIKFIHTIAFAKERGYNLLSNTLSQHTTLHSIKFDSN